MNQEPATAPDTNKRGLKSMFGAIALAMCYVPMQEWTEAYDPDVALNRGTLFPALDKPFLGEKVSAR